MMTHSELLRRAMDAGLIDEYADEYAEPGYTKDSDKPILFANWNPRRNTRIEGNRYVGDDMTMPRLERIFAHYGYAIEWSDEWCTCDECGHAFRTTGDSYSWSMYGVIADGMGCVCGDCVKVDPTDYLESLENRPTACGTILGVDPEAHGYRKVNDDDESFENGFYGGQDADPRKIYHALRKAGAERVLFYLDGVGQFDLAFSVYVAEDEYEQVRDVLTAQNVRADIDPAEALRRALQGA